MKSESKRISFSISEDNLMFIKSLEMITKESRSKILNSILDLHRKIQIEEWIAQLENEIHENN